jgi:hypothetical protein
LFGWNGTFIHHPTYTAHGERKISSLEEATDNSLLADPSTTEHDIFVFVVSNYAKTVAEWSKHQSTSTRHIQEDATFVLLSLPVGR